ncbi:MULTISPECIES: pyridoxal-phosphate dependent enzyme [Anaerolinea]|uniref:Threonine synthase n=1 Tax=Anaerolinea thermophila (strain DSM 14523 / JCM 11388 / NBRC 100420 / UNI-1) TaxID=926569 RepID=E8N447_ANATU|nr:MULTISPECIES: pyridoxal-phosphate dependent enzyme [Anaerolinea]BAJ63211.1 putative threonine synthase [Anaerolinea thermophila UNI-1]
MPSHVIVECLDCGHKAPFSIVQPACPQCGSMWREARYDYDELATTLAQRLSSRPFDIWRYRELLPVENPRPELSMGEGGTPLIRATNLGMMLGNPNIYVKDERQGPTASFKDRQASVTVATLKEAGVSEFVIASTGNVAISYSAYSARAGIKLWAFLTSLVPAAKMREVAIYGTQVIKITGSYDQAKKVAAEFAQQRHLSIDLGARTVPCIESMKTIAFEIAEQLTNLMGDPVFPPEGQKPRWRAPDWYVQAVSGGMGPIGVLKGFEELYRMGWIDRIPKIAPIQAEGCAPMVHAWKQNRETAVPVQSPRTLIATLATGDPGRTYTYLRQKMLAASGGEFEAVSDDEAFRAMHFLAKMEGLSVEPAAAVAFAGLVKLIRAGIIKPHETVVVNCSGHTVPVERNILGEGWARDLVPSQGMEESNEEGLLAALTKVSLDRFPRILIVDDNPDVRRLIRRILQSQGEYKLYEATNGLEAIEMARRELPNLIILDLMMPEMDGFTVLNELKKSPETAEIPVIVVTAKELTPNEKDRLRGHIQTLMQKGDFMSDEFMDEVRALLG